MTNGYRAEIFFKQKKVFISSKPNIPKYWIGETGTKVISKGIIQRWVSKDGVKLFIEMKKKAGFKVMQ